MVIYNLVQIILNAKNLTATQDLDTVLKETINKVNVINSLQKEYDSVAVFVGETYSNSLPLINGTTHGFIWFENTLKSDK